MRTRRDSDNDSLDMLLDTITNTFGGIVFLAMLIVLLMGSARPETAENTNESEIEQVQERIEELSRQKTELTQLQIAQQIVSSLADLKTDPVALAEARDKARRYSEIRDHLSGMLDTKLDLSQQMQKSVLDSRLLKKEISTAEKDYDELESQLKREIESRNQDINLPRERQTRKGQTVGLVKANQLFLVDRNMGNSEFAINSNHFETCGESDAVLVLSKGNYRPRPNAGISLSDSARIRNSLNLVDANNLYVTIAIWGDSFAEFPSLRDACKEMQLEYELILMEPDGKIAEAPRSRAPRVQ